MENIVDNTLVQMTFVLLILSMVSEKATNFVKLNFPQVGLRRMLNPTFKITPQTTVEDYEEFEAKRTEREVQVLAIVIGIAIALLTRASIFQIYVEDYRLGWIGFDISYIWSIQFLQDVLGCIITGVFLSLGSKFFHDLLGLIYQFKEAKSRIAAGPSSDPPFGDLTGNIAVARSSTLNIIQDEIARIVDGIPGYIRYELSGSESRVDVYLEKDTPITDDFVRFTKMALPGGQTKTMELNYINLDV